MYVIEQKVVENLVQYLASKPYVESVAFLGSETKEDGKISVGLLGVKHVDEPKEAQVLPLEGK